MSAADDRAALMYSLSQALDSMADEVKENELVGYFTVLVFKDKKTGYLSSLESHGANEYATSLTGFVGVSQARLVNQISNLDTLERDEYGVPISFDDAQAYNEIDREFDETLNDTREEEDFTIKPTKAKRKLDS